MYKDKAKQRETDRERQRRRRDKIKAKGVTNQGVTKYPRVSDADFTKLMAQAGLGHVRVSKPGDEDYVPQCETIRRYCEPT